MGIILKFSPSFYEYTENRESLVVTGSTIKECIENLIAQFPVFKETLFDQEGSLTALIIYKDDVIVQNQLDMLVDDHQELLVMPMIYGG
jgi:molybdopterin converting factor small subunit